MASNRIEPVIQYLRTTMLRRDEAGLSDGQLLERFVADRDAAALEALVRRHGRMVLGVCRRILSDPHDAEDCFQATFLVLVRKASSISPPEKIGNWLYGVAQTTAVRVKAANAKRRQREKQVSRMPDPEDGRTGLDDELQVLLDEELARLPDKYRTPIVLCDLESRLRKEVARQLRIPEGTLSSRLTTARRLLGKRLARRGLAVPAGLLAATLTSQAASMSLPPPLVGSTVKAALLVAAGKSAVAAAVSLKVVALTEGALKTMLLTKLKIAAAATLLATLIIGGAGLIYQTQAAEPDKASGTRESKPGQPKPSAADGGVKLGPKAEDNSEIFEDGASWSVILRRKPEAYNAIFDDLLDAVNDYLEVAYANRYEGRIESRHQSLVIRPILIRRQAVVTIVIEDSGGYRVGVHVEIEGENHTNKSDKKNPISLGRDTVIEKAILRRVIEQDRRRQSNETRKRRAHEGKTGDEIGGADRSNAIFLKNVHLDTINPSGTISLVTLEGSGPGPTYLQSVSVARDAKIKVKGGNTFANLKIGIRVNLVLRMRDNQLMATEIRQVGLSD